VEVELLRRHGGEAGLFDIVVPFPQPFLPVASVLTARILYPPSAPPAHAGHSRAHLPIHPPAVLLCTAVRPPRSQPLGRAPPRSTTRALTPPLCTLLPNPTPLIWQGIILPLAGINLHALGLKTCPQIRLHRIAVAFLLLWRGFIYSKGAREPQSITPEGRGGGEPPPPDSNRGHRNRLRCTCRRSRRSYARDLGRTGRRGQLLFLCVRSPASFFFYFATGTKLRRNNANGTAPRNTGLEVYISQPTKQRRTKKRP
jgi:hypothetical protein